MPLIVDDEPRITRSWRRLLRHLGEPEEEIVIAGSLGEAQEVIRSRAPIDAVFSDLYLGDGSGLELLRELCQWRSQLPCMLLSGRPLEQVVDEAEVHGAVLRHKPLGGAAVARFFARVGRRRMLAVMQHEAHLAGLTEREWMLVCCTLDGLRGRALEEALDASASSVKMRRARVAEKLGIALERRIEQLKGRYLGRWLTPGPTWGAFCKGTCSRAPTSASDRG